MSLLLLLLLCTSLSLVAAGADSEYEIHPRAGQNPIVPSYPLFDPGTIPSHHQGGRRLSGYGDLPIDIIVFVQHGNSTGGVPSTTQTIIRAIKSNGQFSRAQDVGSFLGETRTAEELLNHVICAIGVNPPIVASGRQRNMTSDVDLWSLLVFDTPHAQFYTINNEPNGILEATFEGVFINELGSGFTFQYIARMSPTMNNFPTYFVESSPFNVVLGPVHRLSLFIPEGTATGGLPFRPQPSLAIVDRGNNICLWDQYTTVRVELLYGPGQLQSAFGSADYNHTVYNGRATFLGLNFDTAGYPYKLRYVANSPIGEVSIESINITVGVGPAHELEIVRQAAGVRGGIPFLTQPYLLVKDAGGNVLVDDHSSYCTLSISNNPSDGSLFSPTKPEDGAYYHRNEELDLYTLVPHTVQITAGIVTFRNISIDKVGREYRLLYTLHARQNFYGWTGTRMAYSSTFDVTHGDPTELIEITAAGLAWAGGTPFAQQPVIAIVDAGGNIMTLDSVSSVTVQLFHSPTGFPLLGTKTYTVALGVSTFLDLQIDKDAKGYLLRWTTSAGNFYLNQLLDVIPSTEFMLVSAADRQLGDRMGASAACDDSVGIVVVGATGEDRPVDEVQTITTSSKSTVFMDEIQHVRTSATVRYEIQELKLWCASGSSIARRSISSGNDGMTSFRLSWINPDDNQLRRSRHFAAEMPGPMLASMLEADMEGLGEMSVSRDLLDGDHNCLGAAHYRITFVSRRDYVPLMSVEEIVYETNSVGSTYTMERTQESTILGNTFLLTMPVVQHAGHGAHCESVRVGVEICDDPILQPLETTRPLAWNITEIDLAYEIQRSIW